jgi:BCCT family betaine/carnitine transporter
MKTPKVEIDFKIFIPAITVILAFIVMVSINPTVAAKFLNTILTYITGSFGWLFMMVGLGSLVFLLWLAFSRFGKIKLGDADTKPTFSTYSWIAMIFTCGVGGSLIYWAFMEPMSYILWPPYDLKPGSPDAAEWAMTFSLFNWGPTAWAIYTLPSIPIAYSLYVRKNQAMNISSSCSGLLGKYSQGLVGKIIDIVLMFGIIGGTGTAISLLAPMIASLIHEVTGVPNNIYLIAGIIFVWILIFGTSVYFGLEKGIKKLADFNLTMVFLLLAFVFICGPKVFMLSYFVDSVGRLLNNFFEISLWLDPIKKGGFPQGWTIFYMAWWVSYVPLMGLFVARISKGRTIKQVILTQLFWGTLGHWVFFMVLGGYGVHLELNGLVPVAKIYSEAGINAATIAVINAMPFNQLVLPVVAIAMLVFSATCYDSGSFVLASMSSKNLGFNDQPSRPHRVFWALVLGCYGFLMSALGTIDASKTSAVIVGFPMAFVMVIMAGSLVKWLNEGDKNVSIKKL